MQPEGCAEDLGSFDFLFLDTSIWSTFNAAKGAKIEGSKVLLVDRASRYGGSLDAAEDLLQLKHQNENSTVILEEFESALAADHLNKHFILDRRPIVILSGGPVCDLLIESDVTDYLQFRPIEKYGVYTSEGLVMVPTSKEDIFVDPTLSLPEKRKISKLVNLTDAAEIQQPGGAAFADYLETLGLTPRLKELVMVGIAGCQSGDDVEVCSVSRALTSIKSYRLGLGMYAANCSPFLYPVYGSSEIAQAFSRQCAVNGGTFVMGQAKLLRGTTDISGTFEEHRWRATFAALRAPPEHPRTCLRAIAILRSPLNGMSRTSLWRISPLSPINKCGKTISILVLGPDSSCCPNGYFVMHAWLAKEAEGGRDQMECLVETLSRLIDIPSRTPKELGAPAAQLFATFVHASAPVLGFEEEEAFVLNLSL